MKLDNQIARSKGKTIYRDGDKCIKLFDSDYSKADVLNEALNHARVEELGINMPRIIEVMMIDGKWAIIQDYIEGKTLETLMNEDLDNIDKYLTIDQASQKYEALRKQNSKMFWGYLLPGLLYFLLICVILPLFGIALVIFSILLTIFLIRRKKKKRTNNQKSDST